MAAGRPRDWVAGGLLLIAAVLLLANLDSGYLWQDEAETALLARHTIQFGYPRATDGQNLIEVPATLAHGPGTSWVYSPWLPFYLLAAVFAALGESTWTARLPFAVGGLVALYLTWRLVRRISGDRLIQRLTMALLVCSVPFMLHMRQCRYYGLVAALLVGTTLAYLWVAERPTRGRVVALGILLVLLFHTNFGTFIPVAVALALHAAGWLRTATHVGRLVIMALGVAVLTVPWVVFAYRPYFLGEPSLGRIFDHLEYYVRVTNKYLIPLAAMAITTFVWWVTRRRWTRPVVASVPGPITWLWGLLIGCQVVFLLIPDQRHLRYLIPALPLLAVGEAWWLAGWLRRQPVAGAVLTGLALFTNALHSPHVRVPLADFAYELTHRYEGPMEGIVGYLRAHARAGDVVKIPYDDRTLMFYTDVKVEPPSQFLMETYPEWVIIRRDWIAPAFFDSDYFRRIEARYERIELAAPDIRWQNREDPGSHHFRTVQDAPRVVLYRKREMAQS